MRSEPTVSRSGAARASSCQRRTVFVETRKSLAVSLAERASRFLRRRIRNRASGV